MTKAVAAIRNYPEEITSGCANYSVYYLVGHLRLGMKRRAHAMRAIPGIGARIGAKIDSILATGTLPQLQGNGDEDTALRVSLNKVWGMSFEP